jgi:hypothetical protein
LWRTNDSAPSSTDAPASESAEDEIQQSAEPEAPPEVEPVAAEPEAIAPVKFQPEPLVEVSEATEPKPAWKEPVQPTAGDDESIESYMDRLLKRVRGEAGAAPAPSRPAYQAPQPVKAPEPLPEIKPVAVVQETVKPEEYIPRSQAPEQSVNLAAMRELANSAARSAISTHAKQRGGKRAAGSFVSFGVCVALSAGLLVAAVYLKSWLIGGGAIFAVAVSGYWAFQGARHAVRVMRLGRPGEEAQTPAADEPAGQTEAAKAE